MGYPPQPPYGQQPGYPPPGGHPQQGGYPPQPGYPQQGGYPPQQPGYPPQGGYPPPPPPGAPGGYGAPPAPTPVATFSAATLPDDDNVNPYAFSVNLNGQWFIQKGKMIAYYGQIQFEALSAGPLDSLVAGHFHSPLYAHDWVVAQGQGKLLLGDRGFDLNSFDLEDGNLTIRANNLLAFDPRLTLKQSIIPGFLTLLGTGKFIASSNGPVHFVEPPLRVDPQSLLGWADLPSPCHHYDHSYMRGVLGMARGMFGIGGTSGEEHQFEFTGQGTVLMQSSEQVRDNPAMLRELEAQVGMLGVGGLQRLNQVISQRLSGEQGGGRSSGRSGLMDLLD
ncbi:AIM24 family protein [Actinocorallia libanotica]|uniref:Biogenesis AIM24 protein n=1 Tax=Actinocorallia libanotica TaxID=46162 RepID=A0ABN1Q172_9ACTN